MLRTSSSLFQQPDLNGRRLSPLVSETPSAAPSATSMTPFDPSFPSENPTSAPTVASSAFLTIDTTGLPSSVDIKLFNGDKLVRTLLNQGNKASVEAAVPKGLYKVKVIDNAASHEVDGVDCSVSGPSCSVASADLVETLTVDTAGLPSTVDIKILWGGNLFSRGDLVRTLLNQGNISSVPAVVLKGVYKVQVIDNAATWQVNQVACSVAGNGCNVSSTDLVQTLSIDTTGLPSSVDIQLFSGEKLVRTLLNQGNKSSVRAVVLKGEYKVKVIDKATSIEIEGVDCLVAGPGCSVSSLDIVQTLSIDTTGLPSSVDIQLFSGEKLVRTLSNQGNKPSVESVVLKGEYKVKVIDKASSLEIEGVDCSVVGTGCSVASTDLRQTLSIDTTGLPSSVDIQLFSGEKLVRTLSNQGNKANVQVNVLRGVYKVKVIDNAATWEINDVICSVAGAGCSVASTDLCQTLSVDTTGLPGTTDIQLFSGDKLIRTLSNQGNKPFVQATVLKGVYKVKVIDYAASLEIEGVECMAGKETCSVSNQALVATLVIIMTDSQESSGVRVLMGSSVVRTLPNQGQAIQYYKVLKTNGYFVELVDPEASLETPGPLICSEGQCCASFSPTRGCSDTTTATIDLSEFSEDDAVDICLFSGATALRCDERVGGTIQEYVVDKSTDRVEVVLKKPIDIDCSESGDCKAKVIPSLFYPECDGEGSDHSTSRPSISWQPSLQPSSAPSKSSQPSLEPSSAPSMSSRPSSQPSFAPSLSSRPTSQPSHAPSISSRPSLYPSNAPWLSLQPSGAPECQHVETRDQLADAIATTKSNNETLLNLCPGVILFNNGDGSVGISARELTIKCANEDYPERRCVLDGNADAGRVAEDDGGIFNFYFGNLTFVGLEFDNSHASRNGGAIFVRGDPRSTTMSVEDCVFRNNHALYGGAIAAQGKSNGGGYARISIRNTLFERNTATGAAALGAQYFTTRVEISQSTFLGNSAENGGGAIIVELGRVDLLAGNSFTNNSVTGSRGYGAVGWYSSGSFEFDETQQIFEGNTDRSPTGDCLFWDASGSGRCTLLG